METKPLLVEKSCPLFFKKECKDKWYRYVEDMTDKNKDVEIRKGIDPKSFQYELLPPQDPRVRQPVAPFKDEMLEEYGLKSRQELVDGMFALMHKYGGIGLSAIQIGLPFNMFVAGDHESIEKGLKMIPEICYLEIFIML